MIILKIMIKHFIKKFGKIDIALLPYCGFGVYPLRYSNLSIKEKFLAAESKKTN